MRNFLKTLFVAALLAPYSLAFTTPVHATIDGSLKVTSPNGGEVYTVGDKVNITWDATENIDSIYIGWSKGPGSLNWIKTAIPNTGSYTWTVNVGNTTTTQFLIKIIGYDTGKGSLSDESNGYFTVNPKPVVCPSDVKTCSDGSAVTRDPEND